MSLTTGIRRVPHGSHDSRDPGVELAMPRLLIEDGTIIACLRRFDGSHMIIGRHPSADLCLSDDPLISAVHASISWMDAIQAHILHDCRSANGTSLDGVRLRRPAQLTNGARIRIGLTEIVYCRRLPIPGYVSTLTRRVRSPLHLYPQPQRSGDEKYEQ
jgi:hypothetical protein